MFSVKYWKGFILFNFDLLLSKKWLWNVFKLKIKSRQNGRMNKKRDQGIRSTWQGDYAAQWIYIGPSQSESKTQQIDVIEGLAYSPVSFPQIAPSLSFTRSSSCYNREREWAEGAAHATWTVTALPRPSPDILNINDSTLKSSLSFLESERIRLERYVSCQATKRRKTRRD